MYNGTYLNDLLKFYIALVEIYYYKLFNTIKMNNFMIFHIKHKILETNKYNA